MFDRATSWAFLLGLLAVVSTACSEEASDGTQPECTPTDCSSMGINCGPITDSTGACLFCGTCVAPNFCGGGGQANICGCTPRSECEADECGTVSDGCGGTIECGDPCVAPKTCAGGIDPTRCGQRVAEGEICSEIDHVDCGDGFACCPAAGITVCRKRGMNGGCPANLPDLTIDPDRFYNSLTVIDIIAQDRPESDTCPYAYSMCDATGAGDRKALYIELGLRNAGTGPLIVNKDDPNLTTELPCVFGSGIRMIEIRVVEPVRNVVMARKTRLMRCIADSERFDPLANANPAYPYTEVCNVAQPQAAWALQPGWTALENAKQGCEIMDVTDLPAGNYRVEYEVDPFKLVPELDETNNVLTATITLQ